MSAIIRSERVYGDLMSYPINESAAKKE
jgi:hypothetical protein